MKTVYVVLVFMLLVGLGCDNPPRTPDPVPLQTSDPSLGDGQAYTPEFEGLWTLVSIGGEAPRVATTLLISEGQLQGGGYCHSYSAKYTLDGESISVEAMSKYEVGCIRVPTPQEPLYFESIAGAQTVSVQGNRLTVFAPKTTLVYERSEP
ncbi:MAG: META domain-containing protein [Myxococcota bacterium]